VVPIRKLQVGAHRLGANEFGHRIDVRSGDEVEDLADQFNRMAGQLQESYSRLEHKVEERTRDLTRSLHELKVIEELGRAINASLDLDAVLATIVTRAVEVTGADAGAIYSYRGATGVYALAKSVGLDNSVAAASEVPAGADESVLGLAASRREPVSIPDTARDLPVKNVPLVPGCRSMLVVPLLGPDGVLGALVVARKVAGAFPANTIGLMQTFAHQSVLAIANARLFGEVGQKNHELATAHDTVKAQAVKLGEQTDQLLSWNRTLEDRVATQLTEIERVGRLQRFLPPQVVKLIASSDENELLKSHRREVTVVFCDLRGFTALTESAEPEEVMKILREYHATLGECIFRYEGTLERFAGDGILILFNDPIPFADHPQRAVHMAVEMRDNVGKLTETWRSRGHSLGFGIGIALGYATLGQVGFEGRLEYAAVGSVTNLAARLCGEAKAGQILISQRVHGLVGPWVDAVAVEPLSLKGFSRPIPAHDVLRWRDAPAAGII
jgi:class 3 adenylate cyclase